MTIPIRFFLIICLGAYLYGDDKNKNWIPIHPINLNEPSPSETNSSKRLPSTKMNQNIEIIKKLLDHVNQTTPIEEKKKNWYSFEPAEE